MNSELINNKLNDVCNSELINILNHCNVQKFDPEKEGSLKPQGKLEKSEISWEENLIMNLNNMHKSSRDDLKTSYVKYKLFKRDIYGLALVDTGNLVKGTLVLQGEKMSTKSNARVGTAEKGGKGLKVIWKGENFT